MRKETAGTTNVDEQYLPEFVWGPRCFRSEIVLHSPIESLLDEWKTSERAHL